MISLRIYCEMGYFELDIHHHVFCRLSDNSSKLITPNTWGDHDTSYDIVGIFCQYLDNY